MDTAPPDRLRQLPSWLILRLSGPANRLVADALGDPGARADFAVLASLAQFGAMSQADLGRRLAADRSDMAGYVTHLVEEELVVRATDPVDRRRNVITIATAGRRRLAAMQRRIDRAQDDLLAPLNPTRRRELLAILQELVEHHRPVGS